jgi:hypothetical protein
MSTTVPLGFFTVTITPVFGPGTGETVPLIMILCDPPYEGESVLTVMV